MNQRLPRNMFWVDKTKMGDFLKEPLAKKLYEVYIDFKQKLPNQKYHTLKLFNEVFYQCSRIIALNKSMPDLSHVLSDIKSNLGWDYSTSIVVNMMYVVLSLQKNKTPGVTAFIKSIEHHYRLGQYRHPFIIWQRHVWHMVNILNLSLHSKFRYQNLQCCFLANQGRILKERDMHLYTSA